MKRFACILAFLLIGVGVTSTAFADCRVTAVSNVPSGLPSTLIAPDQSNAPAGVAAGGSSEPISGLLISEDNAIGAPQCFSQGQVLTLTFNAAVTSPTSLSLDNFTIFDSFPSNGLAVSPTLSQGLMGSTLTISVSRAGSLGDPTQTTGGSAVWLKNFRLDLTNAQSGNFASATISGTSGRLSVNSAVVVVGQVATAGPLAFTASTLNFGQQMVNTASNPQTVELVNNGKLGATILGLTSSPGFSQTNTCGTRLEAGAKCSISVSFSPVATGSQAGTIAVNDNASGSPHIINASGTGIASPGTPAITALVPSHVIAGGPNFQLIVQGSNFAPGSVVSFNGSPRTTTYVAADTVKASILASDIATVGVASIGVSNLGAAAPTSLPLQIVANPLPSAPFVYALPHVPQGGGYVTKITLTNLSPGLQDSNVIVFLNQDGSVANVIPYTIAPFGTFRYTTPASARFGPAQPPQWAIVAANTQLAVNLFFELADTNGKILNSVGFNNPTPATDLSFPVEFERPVANGFFTRTAGLALANMSDTPNQIALQLFNAAGTAITGNYVLELAPYAQTAIDLSQIPMFAAAVPSGNVVGTVSVSATQPVSSVALVDDVGPFASTPPASSRSNLHADDVVGTCPAAAELQQMNRELRLSFESDPTAGTLVCRAAEGSLDLTQGQLRAYQALRILRTVTFDAPLPFTSKATVYDWLRGAVSGIRFRGDVATSGCCTLAGFLDISLTTTSPALSTTGWVGPYLSAVDTGLADMVSDIVHLARINEGFADTCGALDQTISEVGPWAVTLDWQDYIAGHSAAFFDDTVSGDPQNRYRTIAARLAAGFVNPATSKFCTTSGLSTVQPLAGIDFGTQPVGDPPALRSVTVNSTSGTPFFAQASTINGTGDFSIKKDGCDGAQVPPSCVVVVAFQPLLTGTRQAQLQVGSVPVMNVPLTGFAVPATPIPASPYVYYLPHVVTGNGYVTKITLSNQVNVASDVVVQFVTQAGTIAQTTRYSLPAGGALRIATPEAARFGASTTQWAIVGSTQPLLANLFFEVEDASTKAIVNTVGFNASAPLSSFSFPVEFEPFPDGTPGGRTAGLAMANPGSLDVTYAVSLLNSSGASLATVNGKIPAYGQVAFDLATIAAVRSVLPNLNFVGSVQVQIGNGQVSAIALEDDFGPFSATPVVSLKP